MFSGNKLKLSVALLLPLFIAGVSFLFIKRDTINLFTDNSFTIQPFSDQWDGGNSFCRINKTDDGLKVTYQINEGITYPYAGFLVEQKDLDLYSVKGYSLQLEINAPRKIRLPLRITVFHKGITNPDDPNSYIYLMKTVTLQKGINRFTVNTGEINEIPAWWYMLNDIYEGEIIDYNLDLTRNMSFNSDPSLTLGEQVGFTVKRLALVPDYTPFYTTTGSLLLGYYILVASLYYWKKRKTTSVFIPIHATEVNETDKKGHILAFIGKNYTNHDLKLSNVAREVGISDNQISEILKAYSGKGFKAYVNTVRLEEAKRLLKETKLPIADIGYRVGYNSAQHFNRVFKESFAISPKSYRESSD